MGPRERLIYLGAIPLVAAAIGGTATYLATDTPAPQVVLTRDAVEAAKDGLIKVEITAKSESKSDWPQALLPISMLGGLALMFWALNKA